MSAQWYYNDGLKEGCLMNFKMKMAFIFQPYLLMVILGLFATYGYYHYADNKYMTFIGVAITLGNLYAYINMLMSKAIILRGIGNKIMLTLMCVCAGIGQIQYKLGTTSSVIISVALITLLFIDAKSVKEIIKDNKFMKELQEQPQMIIYLEDFNIFSSFKKQKDRKITYDPFTFLNNGLSFDGRGIKGSTITFEDVRNYTKESMVSIKDFDTDSFKTIEMLKY